MPASAVDNLGAHLLGRRPRPFDPRDYRLEDYLESHARLADTLSPDTTLAQLPALGPLTRWHEIYAFWHWLKVNVLNVVQPQPGPIPGPPPPPPVPVVVTKPLGGWHDADDPTLDQGQTPHCVGFEGADLGNSGAPDLRFADQDGHRLYYLCEPGDVGKPVAQQQGSTSGALCKVLVAQGVIGAYAFANALGTVVDFIENHGQIGVGTDWTSAMFTPDANNYVRPNGPVEGGHEYGVVDYLPGGHGTVTEPTFKLLNHWGANWGEGGFFYMRASDLWDLVSNGGDAFAGLRKVA